jgi:hypothetical protein
MQEPTSNLSEELYQSQWWTRLAAFSKKQESQAPEKISLAEGRPSVGNKLASIFRELYSNQERDAITW